MDRPRFLIVGVGPATGQAVCRALAGHYQLVLVARSRQIIEALAVELPDTFAYVCDVSDRTLWAATLTKIIETHGMPKNVLINTESAPWGPYNQLPLDAMAASFDVNVTGLLNTIQCLFPDPDIVEHGIRVMVSSSPAAYTPPTRMLGLAPSRVAQRVLVELLNEILSPKV